MDRWERYCKQRGVHPLYSPVKDALNFLQELLDDESVHRGFSAIGTARSALSSVLIYPNGLKFGDIPEVKLFLKGVFNLRPVTPRYLTTWDPDVVLEFLKTWSPAKSLSLKQLSMKLVVLILLVSGRRGQILPELNVDNMVVDNTKYVFIFPAPKAKEGRPGYTVEPIKLKKFSPDRRLCVHHYLTIYLERTLLLRGAIRNVFVTSRKPYKVVSRDTFSRWVKTVLKKAGIDTSVFSAGSTRAASTSKAFRLGAPLDDILKGGGWSRATTFSKWYKKDIMKKNQTIGDFVLGGQ